MLDLAVRAGCAAGVFLPLQEGAKPYARQVSLASGCFGPVVFRRRRDFSTFMVFVAAFSFLSSASRTRRVPIFMNHVS